MPNVKKENKKIKNASPTSQDGLNFKSALEKTIYNTLVGQGINPAYESVKYDLSGTIKPTQVFYVRSTSFGFHYEMRPLSKITYTPDFTFEYNGIFVIVEAKGIENDVFPLKKNLFRKLMETWDFPAMFFEVRSKKEVLQALDIVKMETKELTDIRKLIPKLPDKEYPVANRLLAERDFNTLETLVNKVISKVEKDRNREEQNQKYREIDLDALYHLVTNISMITIHEDIKGY